MPVLSESDAIGTICFTETPGHTGWKQVIRDIEDIMVQLQYNLSDTVNNIDPHHRIIVLQYNY